MTKRGFVYIMTNPSHTVIYTGVTSNLIQRVWQHKNKQVPGFTARYNITQLVYYEVADEIMSAIAREKQIKAGSRRRKIELINRMNLAWRDLYGEIASPRARNDDAITSLRGVRQQADDKAILSSSDQIASPRARKDEKLYV